MTFPADPLDVHVELNIGEVWTDITSDVYLRDPISITAGRADEASTVDSSKCVLTLNNRSGKYSPRNPRSPYYGLLGRNTPIRVTVPGPRYLLADPSAGTPGALASDIAGPSPDVDVRFDAALTNWIADGSTQLAGRGNYYTGSEDWVLMARDGNAHFEWSPTGTGTIQADSTLPLPVPASGRLAVRATLDVDNGAGGWTVTFYTAPTMNGPWTPLGDPVTGSGVTSVHAGGVMHFGTGWPNLPFPASAGRIYGFQVLDGIDGPPLSVIDMATITVDGGGALLLDPQGTYWTLNSGSSVDDRYRRFTGEVSYWPQRWDVSGNDVYTPLTASGILRRLGQGDKPLQSALRRRLTAASPTPLAYWPFEGDGTDTDRAYSPLPDVPAMRARHLKWAADSTLVSSSPLPTVDTNGYIHGRVPASDNYDGWHVEMVYRLNAMPASDHRMLRVDLAGTRAAFAEVRLGHDYVLVQTTDSDGNTIDFVNGTDPAIAAAISSNTWQRMMLFSGVDAAGKTYIRWQTVSVETGIIMYAYLTVQDGSRAGRVDTVSANWGSAFEGMSIGHLTVFDVGGDTGHDPGVHAFYGAVQAFAGEAAHDRITRLAGEENVPLRLISDASGSELVGPQRVDTFLDLVQAAVDVDGGMLHEDLADPGLVYRTRGTLYSQPPALSLNYEADGEVMPPLEPVDDDQATRNDVTVSREGGSSAHVVQATGPLSVQAPPVGVGLYDTSLTVDAYQDRQLLDLAAWHLHLGTWDEARYPTVHIALHAAPHLIPAVLDLRLLDRAQIANPPAWLPPDPIDLIVEGYTETIGAYTWDLEFNCSPAGPWTVGATADVVTGPGDAVRADTDGSELAADVAAGDTTILVRATDGPAWTEDLTDLPFDVNVGGEIMRVSDGLYLADTFNRTVTGGWGTADTGQPWTVVTGSAADFEVSTGKGRIEHPTNGAYRIITAPMSNPDFDVRHTFTISQDAAGDLNYLMTVARYTDDSLCWFMRTEVSPAGDFLLSLRKRTPAAETFLTGYDTGLTFVPGRVYRVRFSGQGTTLTGKLWEDGTPEPDWQMTATDTEVTAAGSAGFRTLVGPSSTTPLPVIYTFDDFEVREPAGIQPAAGGDQTFTVIRGVNGIDLDHPAGTDVRLAHPAIVAL